MYKRTTAKADEKACCNKIEDSNMPESKDVTSWIEMDGQVGKKKIVK